MARSPALKYADYRTLLPMAKPFCYEYRRASLRLQYLFACVHNDERSGNSYDCNRDRLLHWHSKDVRVINIRMLNICPALLRAEYFRHGIIRTFSYGFYDESENWPNCEANFGLVKHDLTPKPGYMAISNLIKLLKDDVSAFKPGIFSLFYKGSAVGTYTQLQYVHDLFCRRAMGITYLLLWHEISNAATSNGTPYPSTAVDVNPPPTSSPRSHKIAEQYLSCNCVYVLC